MARGFCADDLLIRRSKPENAVLQRFVMPSGTSNSASCQPRRSNC
jgi:hypothetical protein